MSFSQSTQSSRKLCWSILKYSRATTRGGQPDVIDHKLDLPIDWQEFSQYGLELELEFRDKTDLRRTLAAQLTIVWVDTGTNMVYESVDLNSFSPLVSQMSTMPIKVAYQKSVVGIRYAVKGCWRRFQIKFHTPDDAQSFIDSIQHICPCKDTSASTSSSRAPLTSSQLLPQQQTQTQMRTSGGSGSSSPSRPQPSQRRKRQPSFSDLESLMMPPPPPRRPAASAAAAHMRFEAGSQRPSSSSSASPSRPSTTDRRSEVSRTTFRPSPLFSQAAAGDSSADHEEDDDDDVRASQPTRSKRPRRSSSQHRDHADGRATLLQQADLVEAMRTAAPSALYDGSLGDQQLEAMIEDIVCEDGFVELCTKVQRMWRARVIGAARPSASSPLQQHAPS